MAAPANKTINDLNGKWLMNKTLSDSPEPGLALQGIGYLTRKAVGLTTVTLHIKQFMEDGVMHIDIDQTATGGIKGTSENRRVDGERREHSDWLFGTVSASSQWAGGEHPPVAEFDSVKAHDPEYLTKDWLEGPEEATGPGGANHLVNSVRAENGGTWTAAQVWGFEMIGDERRYTRHVVLKKGPETVHLRLVYDYLGEEP